MMTQQVQCPSLCSTCTISYSQSNTGTGGSKTAEYGREKSDSLTIYEYSANKQKNKIKDSQKIVTNNGI